MNTVTVRFLGLNVHFNRERNRRHDYHHDLPPHRVVVPHFTTLMIWNGDIPVHRPVISFEPALPIELPCMVPAGWTGGYLLSGQTLRVTGGKADGFHDHLACVPSLTQVWPDMEVDPYVVVNRAGRAAAYFDIHHGHLRLLKHQASAATELTIAHESAPMLEIDCWAGNHHHTVVLPPDVVITVSNTAQPEKPDGDSDFVLSFAVASQLPPSELHDRDSWKQSLGAAAKCIDRSPEPGDLGIGCSNSQYP